MVGKTTEEISMENISKQSELQFWLESYQFWSKAITVCNGYPSMLNYNRVRKNLARAIRAAETKLNRTHRHLPKLGCVQYMGNGK